MRALAGLTESQGVGEALASFNHNLEGIIAQIIRIQQIPAPTFNEAARADYLAAQFATRALVDVGRDELNNVFARISGRQPGPPLVISAHLDTVFPAATDLAVRRENGRIYGPGIADNSTAVAALLVLADTLAAHGLQPAGDVWLVANVGEEGLGNLFGMRAVVERFGSAARYLVLEGGLFGQVLHRAIAVSRHRIEARTGGGHSWKNFGRPSAIHELGRIIAAIAGLSVPQRPWTTFNVGVIEGGTSINTIAPYAALQLDLRSEALPHLERLRHDVEAIVAAANARDGVDVTMTQIGQRPAGASPRTAPLVRLAEAALHAVGHSQVAFTTGSTDANIPLSHGYAAVCIGLGVGSNAHRLDEFLETADLARGLGQLLLIALAAGDL